jgi:hypothetical protein
MKVYRNLFLVFSLTLASSFISVNALQRPSLGAIAAQLQTVTEELAIAQQAQADMMDEIVMLQQQIQVLEISGGGNANGQREWMPASDFAFGVERINNTSSDIFFSGLARAGAGQDDGQDRFFLEVRAPDSDAFLLIGNANVSRRFNQQLQALSGVIPPGYGYRVRRQSSRAGLSPVLELRETIN